MNEPAGILPVDKPEGPTSHDVVARARRELRLRRIGHTGTLDPFASGLLLLCLGPATRVAEYLTALPKSYRAVLRLGQTTDTDDGTGRLINESEAWTAVGEHDLRNALATQTGELDQLPPIFSAKKVDGERMYAVARRGDTVERSTVRVTVYAAELIRFDPPFAEFSVECSSGTYIRSIARDIGEVLGVGAHLTALRRTRVGRFDVDGAVTVDALGDPALVGAALIPASAALSHLPGASVDAAGMRVLGHGGAVPAPEGLPADRPIAMYSPDGQLAAVGQRVGDQLRPRKVFV
ncbi:MAG: tRNA pseudouridine(55) synthase TruB [Gemmatimonadetes bacterium]|nr:tRNA pseudouridine(55) synthase TruB [Gemmatimonadota bacterium]